jgi:hypothetical protein
MALPLKCLWELGGFSKKHQIMREYGFYGNRVAILVFSSGRVKSVQSAAPASFLYPFFPQGNIGSKQSKNSAIAHLSIP